MVFEFINSGMDYILSPLLNLPALLSVTIVSVGISFIITIVYKLVTNQSLMKDLKTEIKELQKQMKQLKDNPNEMMKVQKKAMESNMKYMTHSFKPTLITFIPIILIFGWMSSNFAYEPIHPGQNFDVVATFEKGHNGEISIKMPEQMETEGNLTKNIENAEARWTLKGREEGTYFVEFSSNGANGGVYEKEIKITNGKRYSEKTKAIKNSKIKSIFIDYKKLTVLPIGYKDWLGWLGVYILLSLAATIGLRKVMKVY